MPVNLQRCQVVSVVLNCPIKTFPFDVCTVANRVYCNGWQLPEGRDFYHKTSFGELNFLYPQNCLQSTKHRCSADLSKKDNCFKSAHAVRQAIYILCLVIASLCCHEFKIILIFSLAIVLKTLLSFVVIRVFIFSDS